MPTPGSPTVVDVLKIPLAEIKQAEEGEVGRVRLMRNGERLHVTVEALELEEPPRAADDSDPEARAAADLATDAEPTPLISREIDLIAGENVVISLHDGPSLTLDRLPRGARR